jgi:uncharacterized protein YbaP (TraB family)
MKQKLTDMKVKMDSIKTGRSFSAIGAAHLPGKNGVNGFKSKALL